MRWGDMKTLATGRMHRGDIPWDALQGAAWVDVGRQLHVPESVKVATMTMGTRADLSGVFSAALPTDFARVSAVIQAGVRKYPANLDNFLQGVGEWVVAGAELWTRSGADVVLMYGSIPATMTSDDIETTAMARYPNVMLAALMVHGASWAQDFDIVQAARDEFNAAVFEANSNAMWVNMQSGQAPVIRG